MGSVLVVKVTNPSKFYTLDFKNACRMNFFSEMFL